MARHDRPRLGTRHPHTALAKRDAPVIEVMRELAAQYPRFGDRRSQVFLERRGLVMSADRAHRIAKNAGLQVPRRVGK
jgi:putative transposase